MILVVNAGSSNVKLALYDPQTLNLVRKQQVTSLGEAFKWISAPSDYTISSVGHRIVHGGTEFLDPIILDDNAIKALKKLIPLAPLHQPYNIAAVEELKKQFPDIPQVGCFDTAFHSTQHPLAKLFAIPASLTTEGVLRYGFHGLSYEYIASILVDKIGSKAKQKIIVAHLGNGASMCALENLQSVATSMGFSALDGLMMGTRAGCIDPGVLLYLLEEKNYNADELYKFLYNDCGLLGVSGLSNDVRELLHSNTRAAHHALDLFCYKAATEFGKLLVSLGGCDGLVFTAGIGENAAPIRAGICKWLNWLDVTIDPTANAANKEIISAKNSAILVAVIKTDEECIIAKHTRDLTLGKA